MGNIKFRYNSTTYSLYKNWYVQYDYPTLVDDYAILKTYAGSGAGNEHSGYDLVPALPTKGSKVYFGNGEFGKMYLDTSSPTIAFRKNNKTYYCAKSLSRSSKYTITYNSNSGSGTMSIQSFYPDDGETLSISSNSFTKTGYSFSNWNTNSSNSGTSYTSGAKYFAKASITLYAIWKVISYSITYSYDVSSRVSASPSKTSYTVEEAVTPANPTMKAGYSFTGWSPTSIAKGSTGNKTFVGSTSINSYAITYNLNGGTLSSNPNPSTYTVEDAITFTGSPTPPKSYYTFSGWSPASIVKGSTGAKTVQAQYTDIGPLIEYVAVSYSTSQAQSMYSVYFSNNHWFRDNYYYTTIYFTISLSGSYVSKITLNFPSDVTKSYNTYFSDEEYVTIAVNYDVFSNISGTCTVTAYNAEGTATCTKNVTITVNNVETIQET